MALLLLVESKYKANEEATGFEGRLMTFTEAQRDIVTQLVKQGRHFDTVVDGSDMSAVGVRRAVLAAVEADRSLLSEPLGGEGEVVAEVLARSNRPRAEQEDDVRPLADVASPSDAGFEPASDESAQDDDGETAQDGEASVRAQLPGKDPHARGQRYGQIGLPNSSGRPKPPNRALEPEGQDRFGGFTWNHPRVRQWAGMEDLPPSPDSARMVPACDGDEEGGNTGTRWNWEGTELPLAYLRAAQHGFRSDAPIAPTYNPTSPMDSRVIEAADGDDAAEYRTRVSPFNTVDEDGSSDSDHRGSAGPGDVESADASTGPSATGAEPAGQPGSAPSQPAKDSGDRGEGADIRPDDDAEIYVPLTLGMQSVAEVVGPVEEADGDGAGSDSQAPQNEGKPFGDSDSGDQSESVTSEGAGPQPERLDAKVDVGPDEDRVISDARARCVWGTDPDMRAAASAIVGKALADPFGPLVEDPVTVTEAIDPAVVVSAWRDVDGTV